MNASTGKKEGREGERDAKKRGKERKAVKGREDERQRRGRERNHKA